MAVASALAGGGSRGCSEYPLGLSFTAMSAASPHLSSPTQSLLPCEQSAQLAAARSRQADSLVLSLTAAAAEASRDETARDNKPSRAVSATAIYFIADNANQF